MGKVNDGSHRDSNEPTQVQMCLQNKDCSNRMNLVVGSSDIYRIWRPHLSNPDGSAVATGSAADQHFRDNGWSKRFRFICNVKSREVWQERNCIHRATSFAKFLFFQFHYFTFFQLNFCSFFFSFSFFVSFILNPNTFFLFLHVKSAFYLNTHTYYYYCCCCLKSVFTENFSVAHWVCRELGTFART